MARLTKKESDDLKDQARLVYIHEGLTNQKELAKRIGVGEKTIGVWIKEGNWKKYQRNFLLTREEQMANLLEELTEINESIKKQPEGQRFADAKTAQIRRQLIKDIKDLETKAQLPEIISAMTQFVSFIRKTNLKEAQQISHSVQAFIKSKLR